VDLKLEMHQKLTGGPELGAAYSTSDPYEQFQGREVWARWREVERRKRKRKGERGWNRPQQAASYLAVATLRWDLD